jgi:uncharacterized protein YndB with AHSA1/START domain
VIITRMTDGLRLRMERTYRAPAQAVFDAWTNEEVRCGRYTEIDPPRRLAFTWLWDDHPTRMLIELDLDEADGVTTVTFTHSGLWDEEAVRSHEGGWTRAFDNLQRTLEDALRAG